MLRPVRPVSVIAVLPSLRSVIVLVGIAALYEMAGKFRSPAVTTAMLPVIMPFSVALVGPVLAPLSVRLFDAEPIVLLLIENVRLQVAAGAVVLQPLLTNAKGLL